LDSAIRSSRVSCVGGTGLARRIRAADGIVLENGVWVPKGSTVGVAQGGIHFDENCYERAWEFDAFRFSRSKEELTSEGNGAKDDSAAEREEDATVTEKPRRNEDLVTTSPQFLAFSHGLHAWSVSSLQSHSTSPYTDLSPLMLAPAASSLPTN
jgi:hypothetical protein